MASKVTKTMKVSANGVFCIDGEEMSVEVEDVGIFSLKKLLEPFDGYSIKLSCSYDEEQESPDEIDVDPDTGEII